VPVTDVDRAKRASFFLFILMGHLALSFVAWVPEFIDRLGVSFITWGIILGFAPVGAIAAILIAPRLILRFGSTPVFIVGILVGSGLIIPLGVITDVLVWTVVHTVFHVFMSLAGMSLNAHAVSLQGRFRYPILGGLHAGWSIGAVAAALSGALAVTVMSLTTFFALVGVVSAVLAAILSVFLLKPHEDSQKHNGDDRRPRFSFKIPGRLWLIAFALVCAFFPEVAVLEWSAVLVREEIGADTMVRSVPFGAFMAGMIVGRLSLARMAKSFQPASIAMVGSASSAITMTGGIAIAFWLVSVSPTIAVLALSALWALAGFGLAALGPTAIAETSKIPGVSGAHALAMLSFTAQLSAIGAKILMGAIAQEANVYVAFIVPVIFFAVGAILASQLRNGLDHTDISRVQPPTGPIPIIRPGN
jgi:hypothetical protein